MTLVTDRFDDVWERRAVDDFWHREDREISSQLSLDELDALYGPLRLVKRPSADIIAELEEYSARMSAKVDEAEARATYDSPKVHILSIHSTPTEVFTDSKAALRRANLLSDMHKTAVSINVLEVY